MGMVSSWRILHGPGEYSEFNFKAHVAFGESSDL